MTPTLLALDLSKKRTGYAIVRLDGTELKFVSSGSITMQHKTEYNRDYFRAGRVLTDAINEVSLNHGVTTVAVEAPIFGREASELQFLLNQHALAWAQARNLDTVSYSTMLIKSFAKQLTTDPDAKFGKSLTKNDMYELYDVHVRPNNPGVLPDMPPSASDDEIDATFLALLAAHTQLPLLRDPDGHIYSSTPDDSWNPLLWGSGNHFSDLLFARGLQAPSNLVTPKLTKLRASLRENGHLSTSSALFYPYGRLAKLTERCKAWLAADQTAALPVLAARFGETRPKPKPLKYDVLLNNLDAWSVALSGRGELYIDTSATKIFVR